MRTVGAYAAKTYLPSLLDEVEAGEIITITRHGVPVARLVPTRGVEGKDSRGGRRPKAVQPRQGTSTAAPPFRSGWTGRASIVS